LLSSDITYDLQRVLPVTPLGNPQRFVIDESVDWILILVRKENW